MDCTFFGKLDPTFVVAVGDKSGRVTLVSYVDDFEYINTLVVEQYPTAVLGLSICVNKGIISTNTKGGN